MIRIDSSDARIFLAEFVPSENDLELNSNGDAEVELESNCLTLGLISITSDNLILSLRSGRSQ